MMQLARSWSALATPEGARQYAELFQTRVMPQLARIEGHAGALVLERALADGQIEIKVITLWASLEAIKRFAGEAYALAVVEPEARALLSSFEDRVEHHSVVLDSR